MNRLLFIIALLLYPSAAAGQVASTIGPGQTYPTVTLWEADSYGVTTGQIALGEMRGTTVENPVLADTTPSDVRLYAWENVEHDGTQNSGVQIVSASAHDMFLIEQMIDTPVVVEGIEFNANNLTMDFHGVHSTADWFRMERCLVHSWRQNSSAQRAMIYVVNNDSVIRLANNIVLDGSNAGAGRLHGIWVNTTANSEVTNNTVVDLDSPDRTYGIRFASSSGHICRNNIVNDLGAGGVGFNYQFLTAQHSHNISEDHTGDIPNETLLFRNPANGDYHLNESDHVAIETGVGPVVDPRIPVVDIDLDTRAGPTADIGADEIEREPPEGYTIGPGQTYATVTLWEADSYGVTVGEVGLGELRGSTIENPVLTDTTPSSVQLFAGEDVEHDGTANSGVQITPATTVDSFYIDEMAQTPVRIEGVEFNQNLTLVSIHGIHSTAQHFTIERCLFHGARQNTTGNRAMIYVTNNDGFIRAANNIVFDCQNAGSGWIHAVWVNTTSASEIYNNTAAGFVGTVRTYGFRFANSAQHIVKNNVVNDMSISGFNYSGLGPVQDSHNLSEDATGNIPNETLSFADPGAGDYHLHESDTAAIDAGLGPAADVHVPIIDIDRDPRIGLIADLGADEYFEIEPPKGILIWQQQVD